MAPGWKRLPASPGRCDRERPAAGIGPGFGEGDLPIFTSPHSMLVTIIADASYCHKDRVAGYGFWIACERGKLAGGGPMRERVGSSLLAEAKAVCIGLYTAVRNELIRPQDSVLLQTDCIGAIAFLHRTATPLSKSEAGKVKEFFNTLVRQNALTVEFRHVRGHTKVRDARSLCNRHCDSRAKQGLAMARQLLSERRNGNLQILDH